MIDCGNSHGPRAREQSGSERKSAMTSRTLRSSKQGGDGGHTRYTGMASKEEKAETEGTRDTRGWKARRRSGKRDTRGWKAASVDLSHRAPATGCAGCAAERGCPSPSRLCWVRNRKDWCGCGLAWVANVQTDMHIDWCG